MKTDELTAHDKSFMRLSVENTKLREKVEQLRAALELIATPKRSDGTYNRCREACEQLARQALEETGEF